MHEFFVWTVPSFVQIIGAASMQDAAEEFLGFPATSKPISGRSPDCFVQPVGGREAPSGDMAAIEYWIVKDTLE